MISISVGSFIGIKWNYHEEFTFINQTILRSTKLTLSPKLSYIYLQLDLINIYPATVSSMVKGVQ